MNNKTLKRTLSALMVSIFIGALPLTALAHSDDDNDSNEESQTLYTTDWLRIRLEPSLDSEILDVKAPYTEIISVGHDGEWVKVWYDNQICYMHSDYLTMFNPNTPIDKNIDDNSVEYDDSDYSVSNVNQEDNDCCADAEVSPDDFCILGIITWGDYRYTWYSENVLPGGGLDIVGRHSDDNGYICDSEGYICLASDSLAKGTIVDTPFGKQGKVYDCGCGSDDILDVYVNW